MAYTARQNAEAAAKGLDTFTRIVRENEVSISPEIDLNLAVQTIQARSLVAIALALTAPSPDEEAAERQKKEREDYQAALRYAADRATPRMYTGPEARQ